MDADSRGFFCRRLSLLFAGQEAYATTGRALLGLGGPMGPPLRESGSMNRLLCYPVCPVRGGAAGQQFRLAFYCVYEVLDHWVMQIGMRG